MEDQTAISSLKQGDLKGLEALFRRYQTRAVHAAYLILHDRQLSEDIAQTAFIKVAERIEQFDDGRPFGPWFFRIVVNDALKLARKRERHVPLEEPQDQAVVQLADLLVDPDSQPDQILAQKEARRIILKAIAGLPPGQRAAVVMRFYLGMSMADMSARTGRPLSTIKWWLRDARRRLHGLAEAPRKERSTT